MAETFLGQTYTGAPRPNSNYAESVQDWQIRLAEEMGIKNKLGVTPMQLITNPQLSTDAQALAKYTGIPLTQAQYRISLLGGLSAPAGGTGSFADLEGQAIARERASGINYTYGGTTPATTPTSAISVSGLQAPTTPANIGNFQDTTDYKSLLATLQTIIPKPESGVPDYLKSYLGDTSAIGINYDTAQKQVSDLTAQLAGITNTAKQAQLQLESGAAGKDVTTTFLGRQQQEIGRQAAIQALPIATQLEAAKGNLSAAQAKLDKLFDIQSKYQDQYYNWHVSIGNALWDYMTTQEQHQWEAKKEALATANQNQQSFYDEQKAWASQALESGQANLIPQIYAAKDRNELARVIGQIRQPVDELKNLQIQKLRQELSSGVITEEVVSKLASDYTWNDTALNKLTAPMSFGERTAFAYEKAAILAFAYASSGKQMSWSEAQNLAKAYLPNILDSNETKINKLLSLESNIKMINATAKPNSPELTQGRIALNQMNKLKQELGIVKKDSSTGGGLWTSAAGNQYKLPW